MLDWGGGVHHWQYFKALFPTSVDKLNPGIAHKELWAIVVACKLWADEFKGRSLKVSCDNLSMVQVINLGRSRDELLQKLMWELHFCAAVHEFRVKAVHIPGKDNTLPDLLSH